MLNTVLTLTAFTCLKCMIPHEVLSPEAHTHLLELWKQAMPEKPDTSKLSHNSQIACKVRSLTLYSSSANSDYRVLTNSEILIFKSMYFRFCLYFNLRLHHHKSDIPLKGPTLPRLTFSTVLKFLYILFKQNMSKLIITFLIGSYYWH